MSAATPQKAKLKRAAIHVSRTGGCSEAWFYENPKSIDVYCHAHGQPSRWCRIPRVLLEDYIRRAKGLSK